MEFGTLPPVAFPDPSRSIPLPGHDPEAETGGTAAARPSAHGQETGASVHSLDAETAAYHLPILPSGSPPLDQTTPAPEPAVGLPLRPAGAPVPDPFPPLDAAVDQPPEPHRLPALTHPVAAAPAPAEAPVAGPDAGHSASSVPDGAATETGPATGEGEGGPGTEELDEEEQREVQELKQRDREVRQHEQAHVAAAGGHARGGASYEYTTGPDNRRYATGGEVSIDTSKVPDDPEGTIRKAQIVYRAALAPAEPSSQDRSVASVAKQMEAEARRDLAEARREESATGAEGDVAAEPASETAATDAGAEAAGTAMRPASAGGDGAKPVEVPELPSAAIDAGVASLDSGGAAAGEAGQLLNLIA